jgi:hypothetical protein
MLEQQARLIQVVAVAEVALVVAQETAETAAQA